MYKLYTLIALILLVGVANVQLKPLNNQNSTQRTNDYINLIRQHYNKNIEDMEAQIDFFKQNYGAGINAITIQGDMLIFSLNQMEETLRAQEHLSDLSGKCITKYRPLIPTVAETKTKINSCVTTANSKLSYMISAPTSTTNNMQSYYKNTFENSVVSCQKKYSTLPLNYTMCVADVVATTNTLTIKTQKTFAIEMDAAQCSSAANTKQALDCSYTTESNAISGIAEAKTLIDNCILDQDNCKQCSEGYTCSEVYYMSRSDVSYNSKTMNNPFYQRYQATECMMIKLV